MGYRQNIDGFFLHVSSSLPLLVCSAEEDKSARGGERNRDTPDRAAGTHVLTFREGAARAKMTRKIRERKESRAKVKKRANPTNVKGEREEVHKRKVTKKVASCSK